MVLQALQRHTTDVQDSHNAFEAHHRDQAVQCTLRAASQEELHAGQQLALRVPKSDHQRREQAHHCPDAPGDGHAQHSS